MLLFQEGHLCDAHNAHKEILASKNGEMQYIKIRLLFRLVEVWINNIDKHGRITVVPDFLFSSSNSEMVPQ